LSAKYRINETMNLKAAFGTYHQYLHRIPRMFISDIWSTANKYQNQSHSTHYILGFQKEVATNYQLEIEGYYKKYDDIYALNQNVGAEIVVSEFDENGEPIYLETKGLFHEGDGNTKGFEVLFRKEKGMVTGWMGISYASTKYNFTNINNGEDFAPRHDRTITINAVNRIDLKNFLRTLRNRPTHADKNTWTLGLNFVYSTGQPITQPGSAYLNFSTPDDPEMNIYYYPTNINGYRLPAYARLDLSLTYKRHFKKWSIEPYLQVFNVGNRKNIWFIDYQYEESESNIETIGMFPRLPTIGVNFYF
ncbi:MAG: hypothetical protein KAR38_16630, partial [Calditrichia bacterium]|nr:hypothetical protein [Calditrichia bacterium]